MSKSEFYVETARKEELLCLLEDLEAEKKFKPHEEVLKFGFYDRMFNGIAIVSKISSSTLRLKRENGRPLGVLKVTPEIAAKTKVDDHFLVTLGHRKGLWYLVHIQMIGSFVGGKKDPNRMHLSGRHNLFEQLSPEQPQWKH